MHEKESRNRNKRGGEMALEEKSPVMIVAATQKCLREVKKVHIPKDLVPSYEVGDDTDKWFAT